MWILVSQSHPAVIQTQSLAQLAYQWLAGKCYGGWVLSPNSNCGRGKCEPGVPAFWVSLAVRAVSNKHRKQDYSTGPGWERVLTSHEVRQREEWLGFLLHKQFTKCENKKIKPHWILMSLECENKLGETWLKFYFCHFGNIYHSQNPFMSITWAAALAVMHGKNASRAEVISLRSIISVLTKMLTLPSTCRSQDILYTSTQS